MANKHIQALKEKLNARIEAANDSDELAGLKEELKELEDLEKDHDKLLTAYKSGLKSSKGQADEGDEDDEDDDRGERTDETGGKGKKPLSFEEAFAKIVKARPKE